MNFVGRVWRTGGRFILGVRRVIVGMGIILGVSLGRVMYNLRVCRGMNYKLRCLGRGNIAFSISHLHRRRLIADIPFLKNRAMGGI